MRDTLGSGRLRSSARATERDSKTCASENGREIAEKRAALGAPAAAAAQSPGVFCLNVVLTVKNDPDIAEVARLLGECGRLSRAPARSRARDRPRARATC